MLKTAYQVGVLKALEEASLDKEAQGGLLARLGQHWAKLSPLHQRMLAGAGIGGAAGGVTDVGVLPGMGLGAAGGAGYHGYRGMQAGAEAATARQAMRRLTAM